MTLETIIAGFLFMILAACRVALEFFWELACRRLGYWTLRLITFGRCDPDEEGWFCAVVGLLVLVASIWGITEWLR